VTFDIDGTLGQYHTHLENFLALYTGLQIPTNWDGRGNWEDYLKLPRKQYQEGKLAFRQGGWKRWMPPFPHASEVTETARHMGAEIWITTTRPYNRLDNVDPDTQEWLSRNRIHYDHLLYDDQKYEELAKQVDPARVVFVIEDQPTQYRAAQSAFLWEAVFMIQRPHNSAYRENNPRTNSVPNLADAGDHMVKNLLRWKDIDA
jgi:hypothetical protein